MRKLLVTALLLVLLMGCEPPRQPCPGPCPRPRPHRSYPADGSVIFWEKGILKEPIYRNTGSDLTHAAIVLYIGSEPWVYEAVPLRVHRLPLDTYLKRLEEMRQTPFHQRREFSWFLIQPRNSFTADELKAMKQYADSQLGRRYMLRGWWKNREVRGTHCSQLIGNIIERSGWIVSSRYRESPGSLHAKLTLLYD